MVGEAWLQGPIILSWAEVAQSGWEDGVNVVIHECAHKLDMLNGEANGYPPLRPGMDRQEWSRVCAAAYEDFCRQVDGGEETPIDPYGAENPGEFFAVMSEAFFEIPHVLQGEYPELYAQFAAFYGQDPLKRTFPA
jgi:Mlc titration factor MtfA (ptsG expression regulator)